VRVAEEVAQREAIDAFAREGAREGVALSWNRKLRLTPVSAFAVLK
jgi:hypothetical protein